MRIRITRVSPKSVATIQTLRKGLRLKLQEAKDIVEGPPPHEAPVADADTARTLIAALAALGNECELIDD